MSHGSDRRITSWQWTKVSREVRRRDMNRCQWRLEGCTEYGGTTDHIYPRAWMEPGDPRYWDRANLVACCKACNRKRQWLRPGEYGSYGTTPRGGSFFSATPTARGGVLKIPLRSRWSVIRADYGRRKVSDDAG